MCSIMGFCDRGVTVSEFKRFFDRSLSPEQRKKMRIIHLGRSAKYKIRFGSLEQPYQWKAIRNFMDAANAALTRTGTTT